MDGWMDGRDSVTLISTLLLTYLLTIGLLPDRVTWSAATSHSVYSPAYRVDNFVIIPSTSWFQCHST